MSRVFQHFEEEVFLGGEFFIDSSKDCNQGGDTACCDNSNDYIKNGFCVTECCKNYGATCTVDASCCQGGEPSYLPIDYGPQHCSFGINDELTQGHCCPLGQYWDGITCVEAEECYSTSEPGKCPYDSNVSEEFELLLKDYRCLMRDGFQPDSWDPPYNQVCCHIVRYGINGYWWCDIETLGLPEASE